VTEFVFVTSLKLFQCNGLKLDEELKFSGKFKACVSIVLRSPTNFDPSVFTYLYSKVGKNAWALMAAPKTGIQLWLIASDGD